MLFIDLLVFIILPGESLDVKVCETLEEIFRRARFRVVDLEATSMDEEVIYFVFFLSWRIYSFAVYISNFFRC